ncbi:hypothetical protein HNQ50_002474 [Silvimonas terrae]|uniref:Uncharacterized protein n=1 Tax=Silvimonas terrae TaxID=300266 RepID=A0A840RGN4_9NEIS|nr:hypothetical protein [Silvimonas terrae]MBB5191744.1 hypothetical protein [Silvimonas terrae]
MNWQLIAKRWSWLGGCVEMGWYRPKDKARRKTAGRHNELSRNLQQNYGMSPNEAEGEISQFEHKYARRQWLKRRHKSEDPRRSVTVYRVRFWDINTSHSVLSEGFVTLIAAHNAHARVDISTGVEVNAADVRNGRYFPPAGL